MFMREKKMIYKIRIFCLLFFCFLAGFGQLVSAQEKPTSDAPSTPKGLVAGKAISLAKPVYPPEARARRIGAQVRVRITVDESGNVISAKAETGDPLFHKFAEEAALKSKLSPTTLDGVPIKVKATLTFNFVRPPDWESIGSTLAAIEMGIPGVSYGNRIADFLGEELQEEANEYDLLTKDETTDGKAIRATKLINSIRGKLEGLQPIDDWFFRLGLTKSRLAAFSTKTNGEADFQSHLTELTDLYNSIPPGIPTERTDALYKSIQISLKSPLTKEDRKTIVNLLVESYNEVRRKQPQ